LILFDKVFRIYWALKPVEWTDFESKLIFSNLLGLIRSCKLRIANFKIYRENLIQNGHEAMLKIPCYYEKPSRGLLKKFGLK